MLGLFVLGFNGALSAGSGLFVTMWMVLWFGMDIAAIARLGRCWLVLECQRCIDHGYGGWDSMVLVAGLDCGLLAGGYLGAHTSMSVSPKWEALLRVGDTYGGAALITY